MFERYTERARRVIFFARYEASQFGSTTIETEHLLLGLIREDKNLTNRFLRNHSSIESIRKEIEGRTTIHEKVSTSIDLPLSNEGKRILAYAAEEAERLRHGHIGTEHLLLGMLREEKSLASQILRGHGLDVSAMRQQMAVAGISPVFLKTGCVPDNLTAMRIAEAVWLPVYGYETVNAQKPFTADLESDVWTVKGSPPANDAAGALADCTWLLDIGDRRMRIGDVRKPASDFLCKTTSDRDLARFGSLNTAILRDRILDKPEKPA